MADYTYVFADLRTDEILGELPLDDVKFGRRLNEPGAWSGSIPLGDQRITALDPIGLTRPGRTAVYIDRDGTLVDGGIVWTRRFATSGDDAGKLMLAGNGFWSYIGRRVIHSLLTFAATDQVDVVSAILAALEFETGGDIGLNISVEASGVLRDRTYYAYELKSAAEAIEQLAAVLNGFDFRVTVSGDVAAPVKTVEVGYPRIGELAVDSPLMFERPGNVLEYEWPEDATRLATRSYAVGAGEGDDMLVAASTRTDMLDLGYPLLDQQVSYKDVRVLATLQEHADADVDAVATPVTIPSLTVRGDVEPVAGTYDAGDDCRLTITDDRFPDGLDTYARVVAFDVQPPTGEQLETVTIHLGEVDSNGS